MTKLPTMKLKAINSNSLDELLHRSLKTIAENKGYAFKVTSNDLYHAEFYSLTEKSVTERCLAEAEADIVMNTGVFMKQNAIRVANFFYDNHTEYFCWCQNKETKEPTYCFTFNSDLAIIDPLLDKFKPISILIWGD